MLREPLATGNSKVAAEEPPDLRVDVSALSFYRRPQRERLTGIFLSCLSWQEFLACEAGKESR